MRSLLAPLVIGLVLSLVAVFGVQWSAVRAAIDASMREMTAAELAQDADELFGALVVMPGGTASLALLHFDPAFLQPSSGRYYQIVVDGAIALRSPSLAGQSLPVTMVARGERRVANIVSLNERQLILSASGYEFQGRPATIAVAADREPIEAELAELLGHYTQVSVALLAALVVLQIVIVRLALAPLRRIRKDVGRLEQGAITQLGERVPAEVAPLVREVNRMLALVAHRLERSREALGNLAHALKAPVTVLTHMASDERIRQHPELAAQLAEQLQILSRRIDSELRRARVAGGRVPGPAIDLAAEIAALVETMRKLHGERKLAIDCRIDPEIRFRGDREDLLEMVGNLLDNACKWARSRVTVSARGGDGFLLAVDDDGPGCAPDDIAKLAQRGTRLDETVAGHGLGLAIAKGIALSYGAELRFGRSEELGGFRVAARFPSV